MIIPLSESNSASFIFWYLLKISLIEAGGASWAFSSRCEDMLKPTTCRIKSPLIQIPCDLLYSSEEHGE
jgi:hypothetical protein